MLLALDIGNTNITIGIFEDDILLETHRIETYIDDYYNSLKKIINNKKITSIIISSVVPTIMDKLNNDIISLTNINPIIIDCNMKMNIKIKTDDPSQLGADRIVDAVAAFHYYGGPIMIIDFGTATTYDIVNQDGEFIAAITSAGLKITAESLWQKTSKLPKIELKKPNSILATNTIDSMQAGIFYGYLGQVKYIIEEAKRQTGLDFKVIATGGLGKILIDHLENINYDANLTLNGLNLLYKLNL